MEPGNYAILIRERITELRIQKNVSERQMSLDIGKSDSYIGHISNGGSLPSVKELLNIINYLGLTPAEFFMPMTDHDLQRVQACELMRQLDSDDIETVLMIMQRLITLHNLADS